MAKKAVGFIKLQIPAGQANPAPPVGPALGQHSVNMEVAALIMILEPVWTLLLSVSVLGETVEMQKLLGGAVIIGALFCYIRLSKDMWVLIGV